MLVKCSVWILLVLLWCIWNMFVDINVVSVECWQYQYQYQRGYDGYDRGITALISAAAIALCSL